MQTLAERQNELHALRANGAGLVEQVNGRFVAWVDEPLGRLEAITARLADEFSDLDGTNFANEIRAQLKVTRAAQS